MIIPCKLHIKLNLAHDSQVSTASDCLDVKYYQNSDLNSCLFYFLWQKNKQLLLKKQTIYGHIYMIIFYNVIYELYDI